METSHVEGYLKRRADWFDSRDLLIRASRSFKDMIARGAEHYERGRILPKLLPLSADDLLAAKWTHERIIRALERALRKERHNGRVHHWSYDINRHISLLQALRAERQAQRQAQCHAQSHAQSHAQQNAQPQKQQSKAQKRQS